MTKKIWTYIISILCIVGGIFLLIEPVNSTTKIVYYIGLIMLIVGIFKVIASLINHNSMLLPGSYFFSGIINVLFGIILMNNTTGVTKTISIIIGLWLIFNAASNLALVLNYKRNNNTLDTTFIVSNVLKLVLGIIVLTTPILGIVFSSWFIAIILILIGIGILYNDYRNKKVYKVKVK